MLNSDLAWTLAYHKKLTDGDADGVLANLSGADLFRADLSGTKSWFGYVGRYFVASIGETIAIGCQSHSVTAWKLFSDQVISEMAPGAVGYWARYKQAILAINEATNK